MMKSITIYILLICINYVSVYSTNVVITDTTVPIITTTSTVGDCPTKTPTKATCDAKDFITSLDSGSGSCTITNSQPICGTDSTTTITISTHDSKYICDGKSKKQIVDCTHQRVLNKNISVEFSCQDLLTKLNAEDLQRLTTQTISWSVSKNDVVDKGDCDSFFTKMQKYPYLLPLTTDTCGVGDANSLSGHVVSQIERECHHSSDVAYKIKNRKMTFNKIQDKYNANVDTQCIQPLTKRSIDDVTTLIENLEHSVRDATLVTKIAEHAAIRESELLETKTEYDSLSSRNSEKTRIENFALAKSNFVEENCNLNIVLSDILPDVNIDDIILAKAVSECSGKLGKGNLPTKTNEALYQGSDVYYGSWTDNGVAGQYSCEYCEEINTLEEKFNNVQKLIGERGDAYTAQSSADDILTQCGNYVEKRLKGYIKKGLEFIDIQVDQQEETISAWEALCTAVHGHDTSESDTIVNIDPDHINVGTPNPVNCYTDTSSLNEDQKRDMGFSNLHSKSPTSHSRKLLSVDTCSDWGQNAPNDISDYTIAGDKNSETIATIFELSDKGGVSDLGDLMANDVCIQKQLQRDEDAICGTLLQKKNEVDGIVLSRKTQLNGATNELNTVSDYLNVSINVDWINSELSSCALNSCESDRKNIYTYVSELVTFIQGDDCNGAVYTSGFKLMLDNNVIPDCGNDCSHNDNDKTGDWWDALTNLTVTPGEGNEITLPDSRKCLQQIYDDLNDDGTTAVETGLNTFFEALTTAQESGGSLGYATTNKFIEASGTKKAIERIVQHKIDDIDRHINDTRADCLTHKCEKNTASAYRENENCFFQIADLEKWKKLNAGEIEMSQPFGDNSIFSVKKNDEHGNVTDCVGDHVVRDVKVNLTTMNSNLEHSFTNQDGPLLNQQKTTMNELCTFIDDDGNFDIGSYHIGHVDFNKKFYSNYMIPETLPSWTGVSNGGEIINQCPQLCDEASFRRRRLLFKLGVFKNKEI